MRNIFKNASFGKAYKTMDGRKAIYIGAKYSPCDDRIYLILEGDESVTQYYPDGKGKYTVRQDIISEWQEPIDEEKLDKLAYDSLGDDLDIMYGGYSPEDTYQYGYKAGYRKGKEEIL